MKKNVLPLVVIALVVAVISTGIFYGLIVSRMDGSAGAASALHFVASGDLEKGRVLKAADFKLNPAPDPGSPSPAKPEDLIGRSLKEAVESGRVITENVLSPFLARGLPNGIPEGMRAVTLHISESSTVVGMLSPGDRVDIQSLLSRNRNGEADLELRTLLQNAVVFNAGPAEGNPAIQGRALLTVLSSPQDAERLTVADAGARLRIVLRGRKDDKIVPLTSTSLLSLGAPPKPVVTSSFLPAAPVRKIEKVEIELNLIQLSEEAMASFAPGSQHDVLSVSSSGQDLKERLAEWKRSGSVLSSSRLEAGKSGEFSWKADSGSVKVRIEPLGPGANGTTQLRIQPESASASDGATATRRIDSNVTLANRHSALVSGLGLAGKDMVLVITPSGAK